jgi:hypothetical protein
MLQLLDVFNSGIVAIYERSMFSISFTVNARDLLDSNGELFLNKFRTSDIFNNFGVQDVVRNLRCLVVINSLEHSVQQ